MKEIFIAFLITTILFAGWDSVEAVKFYGNRNQEKLVETLFEISN